MLSVYSKLAEIRPYLEEVCNASDDNREALGFFPRGVIAEFAAKEQMYVLVETRDGLARYVGHLLFNCRYPRAFVRQMYIVPSKRRQRCAAVLLHKLKEEMASLTFASIYARVASDLKAANHFWDRQGFRVQRVERGGASRGRHILVRCLELDTPQLFDASPVDSTNPLGLDMKSDLGLPLFLVDLNVLYDLGPRRLRHTEAAALFAAERMNFCRLAISTELQEELRRTASAGRTDPMADYIRIYPTFPLAESTATKRIVSELAGIIFPATATSLSSNERSDLRHVATAIEHRLAGFVTNDNAILAAAQTIKARYGIEITSSAAFSSAMGSMATGFDVDTRARTLRLQPIATSANDEICTLLRNAGLGGAAIASGWLPSAISAATCSGIWCEDVLVGYLTWSSFPGQPTLARVAIDETSPLAFDAARFLLLHLIEQLSGASYGHQIRLEIPACQAHIRECARALGFLWNENTAHKMLLGQVVLPWNWTELRNQLASRWTMKFPEALPTYTSADQQIPLLTPNGNQIYIDLFSLESFLSPCLLFLPGRPAVITPVRRRFSEPLLGHSRQRSLLPRSSISMLRERCYVSASATYKKFTRGSLLFMYESTKDKGSGAVVAVARVTDSYLKDADSLVDRDLERSVLDADTVHTIGSSPLKTVTAFDNVFALPCAVPLTELRRLGCGSANALITTNRITNDQILGILEYAFQTR